MSDRTFRLILDGKKGQLVKASSPSSAAKKGYLKLSAELGKTSIKFELQETTKDSKKKVYGPYKGCLVKDKIKVKMAGGRPKGQQIANLNPYGKLPIYEGPYNTTPQKLKNIEGYKILNNKIPNQHEIKRRFDELYNMPINIKNLKNLKNLTLFEKQKNKLQKLLKNYQKSNATNENKNELQNKYFNYGKLNQPNKELFNRFLVNANRANKYGINSIEEKNAEIKRIEDTDRAKSIIRHFIGMKLEKENPKLFEKVVTALINKNFKIKNYQEMRKLILEIEPSVPLGSISSRVQTTVLEWTGQLYQSNNNT